MLAGKPLLNCAQTILVVRALSMMTHIARLYHLLRAQGQVGVLKKRAFVSVSVAVSSATLSLSLCRCLYACISVSMCRGSLRRCSKLRRWLRARFTQRMRAKRRAAARCFCGAERCCVALCVALLVVPLTRCCLRIPQSCLSACISDLISLVQAPAANGESVEGTGAGKQDGAGAGDTSMASEDGGDAAAA